MEQNIPKFSVGDKVFAKVKGHCPWPAEIDGILSNQLNNLKYDVFFYGTYQSGRCREEDIVPYVSNRERLGKPRNMQMFNAAVFQMDEKLGLGTLRPVSPPPSPIHVRCTRSQSRSRSVSVCRSEPAIRSRTRSPSASRFDTNKQERGRSKTSNSRKRSRSTSRQEAPVKRGRGRPQSVGPIQSSAEPNPKVMQCIVNPFIENQSQKNQALAFLKNEAVLNAAISGIQANLPLNKKPDLKAASNMMDEFLILDLNALVLKKHPEAIDTFLDLQRYTGHFSNWNISLPEKEVFQRDVKIIQAKAKIVLGIMEKAFNIPEGKDFEHFYEEELLKFERVIEGLPRETVWKISRDPTLV